MSPLPSPSCEIALQRPTNQHRNRKGFVREGQERREFSLQVPLAVPSTHMNQVGIHFSLQQ